MKALKTGSKVLEDKKVNLNINTFSDLLIIDDAFPSKKSGFRYAEFLEYLKKIPNTIIYTTGESIIHIEKKEKNEVIRDFKNENPNFEERLMTEQKIELLKKTNLVYCVFLNNIYENLKIIEKNKKKFVFTLYPGGGFKLNDVICDLKLKRVFNSPSFKQVIVNQKTTYDYLINKKLCPVSKITMIFGVVIPDFELTTNNRLKQWNLCKEKLDVCFMAFKYTKTGEDKGYDVFISAAKSLIKLNKKINYHVIGNFDKNTIDTKILENHIEYYGLLDSEKYNELLNTFDIIVSPNISGKIEKGSFDGFPTTSCIEAGIRGCAIMATDEFQNSGEVFKDKKNIIIIKNKEDIIKEILYYYNNPNELKLIANNGAITINKYYSLRYQMKLRINIIENFLTKEDKINNWKSKVLCIIYELMIMFKKQKSLRAIIKSPK